MTAAEQAVQLFNRGWSVSKIADRLNVPLGDAHELLQRAGVGTGKRRSKGGNGLARITDPNRADKLLRRFSWEEAA